MQIPHSDILSTNAMNRVFDTTTATYKFYWLLALLDMHVKEQKDEMRALDVAARMVAYAWYPTLVFPIVVWQGRFHVEDYSRCGSIDWHYGR